MTQAWFTPDTVRMFAFLSLLSLSVMVKPLATRGRARGAVLALFMSCCALGVVLFTAGVAAMLAGQPSFVTRTLIGAGAIVGIPFFTAWREALRLYTEVELRKTIASDL